MTISKYRWFQCSSASRKFLNLRLWFVALLNEPGFSALQRAENSSIPPGGLPPARFYAFQCSSASRKFLNVAERIRTRHHNHRFSALQRAENSSIPTCSASRPKSSQVSVLFSEPKIPQFAARRLRRDRATRVSVLFSEPKIPQCTARAPLVAQQIGFSALQRAENSSIVWREAPARNAVGFSALQRAENSSMRIVVEQLRVRSAFQCSSASRKFLNGSGASEEDAAKNVSVLFSEPKIPQ